MNALKGSGPVDIPMLVGGDWRSAEQVSEIVDPYRGELVARAPESSERDVGDGDRGVQGASESGVRHPHPRPLSQRARGGSGYGDCAL